MKRIVLAVALACALSGSALAGDVHSTGAPEPAPGDVHTTGVPSPTQSSGVAATVILACLSFIR